MESPEVIFGGLLGLSLVVFVTFVLPIWIFMYYKSRSRPQAPAVPAAMGLTSQDAADLIAIAERMEQRVAALEEIMDAEAPGWRRKS